MTMQLHIHLPDNFPLHGIERDAFETKLRNALHDLFDGHRVRQLVDQVDARRAFDSSGVLSLRHIGDEHTFEQCMTLDHCRFEDMSTVPRRMVLNAVGARLGLDLMEPRIAPLPNGEKEDATNRLPPFSPTSKVQARLDNRPKETRPGNGARGNCRRRCRVVDGAPRSAVDGRDGVHTARTDAGRSHGQRTG
ncbi:hypothetical protein [Paraburkholderia hospita]|uniref:hypothetical protein n=1 Tax=Paraburkholderia hospita TaxID=169430 RepID=UPI0002718B4E|nr:hypothetical protein [Paraburkholderia hospita]EUC20912.1 hypothetical protein PMI06_009631 [Burkholderia sp. BT03]SKC58287.1 hypothetical protein SAMN06266956_0961 [Paraburkholderia hospita]